MSTPIIYREMNAGEEQTVCDLVEQVFNQFVAEDYEKEGINEFFRFANPDAIKERIRSGNCVLVACQNVELVGMLEFSLPDRIALLFVSARHQGVAKNLLAKAVAKICSLNPGLTKLTVHSSPYAEVAYQKMGFNKTGNTITENGITYIPMELSLKD